MQKIITLMMIVCAVLLSACSTKQPTAADVFKGQSAKQIFTAGETAMAKGGYKEAIKHFEGLDTLFPFSEYEEQAQMDNIYAYYKSGEFASAAAAANRFIHLYPRSPNVDYAYYMKGMANFNQDRGVFQRYVVTDLSKRDLSTAKESFADFADLVRRYPQSIYAPDARNRMIYLRNLLAQQQLNVANYYFKRRAYLAAINRANNIVKHFQESPQVIPALFIMAKSYQELGMNEMAEQVYRILSYNYSDMPSYKDINQHG